MRSPSLPPTQALGQTILTPSDDLLEEVEKFVTLLDSQFVIPGTDVRFGLDAIVGLVPGLGDAVALLASAYVYKRLTELDLGPVTRARMVGNILIDAVVGAVPVVGDIFDVAFRANQRNLELARKAVARGASRR